MAQVYLVEFRNNNGVSVFRLMADSLPSNAGELTVSLSMTPGNCMTPVTKLFEHDHHAAGTGDEYVQRVLDDVQQGLRGLDWMYAQPTGYVLHPVNIGK